MKRLHLGAFEINGVNLTSQGLWAHPDNQTVRYNDLDYWIELAQILEGGGFDFLFFADSYGYPRIDGETPAVAFEQAAEIPKNDPMLLIPALAAATSTLSFAVTTSTTFEAPFANARRFATLDHLTRGRIAWNVVTTTSTVVSDLFGHERFIPHDERYAIAEEYLQLSYELFEGSWEDDAVRADKTARVYADAHKVHRVSHKGQYFSSAGYFNSTPSPQRTPVIFQAGASPAGLAFAARNAEVVFLQGADAEKLAAQVAQLRALAADEGRDPRSIKAIAGLSTVVGDSVGHAEQKLADYLSYVDADAMRVYFAQMTGIDLTALHPETELSTLTTEQSRTQLTAHRGRTAAQAFADYVARGGMRDLVLTGTGSDIAESMLQLAEATDLDGFNITPYISPSSYTEFAEHVSPHLRAAGAIDTPLTAGTLRNRLFGGDRVPSEHPAARYRAVEVAR
jgi:FMN-dependent oxidoreductase (nitrilotriacetate monooxygenase family)